MGDDLSHIQVPRGKKGGKKSKRKHREEGMSGSDGEDELRDLNPGRIYFDELFKTVIQDITDDLNSKDSAKAGYVRKCSLPHAHCILYQLGCGNATAMKKATGNVTMAKAFVRDHNNEAVGELPGPLMIQARKQYRKFIKTQYPDIWAKYDTEDWTAQKNAAFKVFQNAYATWESHMDAKADGAAAGDKRAKKKDRKAPASDDGIKTDSDSEDSGMGKSPKDRKLDVPIQTNGLRVLGIVGTDKIPLYQHRLEQGGAGGSAAPIPTEVVASYAPGVELPTQLPMLQAVNKFVKESVKKLPVPPAGAADKSVKKLSVPPAGAADKPDEPLKIKTEPGHVPTDKESRAAKREQTKLLPSDGFMDLTGDTDSD
jgi:hypothetical protein